VSEAASRYLDVADYLREVSGEFFASAPKKMIGPLHKVELPHVRHRQSQEGTRSAVVEVAGGVDYPVAA
jgi:hypothetical protein